MDDSATYCDNCGQVVGGPAGLGASGVAAMEHLEEYLGPVARWQYAIVSVGAFNSPERMAAMLDRAGRHGWELVTVYDKASNWWQGMEKGFMMLKRPVPEGATPSRWSVVIRG